MPVYRLDPQHLALYLQAVEEYKSGLPLVHAAKKANLSKSAFKRWVSDTQPTRGTLDPGERWCALCGIRTTSPLYCPYCEHRLATGRESLTPLTSPYG